MTLEFPLVLFLDILEKQDNIWFFLVYCIYYELQMNETHFLTFWRPIKTCKDLKINYLTQWVKKWGK